MPTELEFDWPKNNVGHDLNMACGILLTFKDKVSMNKYLHAVKIVLCI